MEELNTPIRVSFAQNREDIFLDYFFKDIKNGFYVDVGANDPTEDSVTKLFYEKGWTGINVEPIKRLFDSLVSERPKDINLNIGIASKNGEAKFREYHTYHGLSTMDSVMQESYSEDTEDDNYKDFTDYTVEIKTLKSVFKEHNVSNIHFMKIDVEGLEYEVIAGNDWKKYRPEVLCIESNHIAHDWRPLIESADYTLTFNDGLNSYYVAKEAAKRAENFSYISAVLPTPVIGRTTAEAINQYIAINRSEKNTLIHRNSQLSHKLHEIEHELYLLNEKIVYYQGVKNLTKSLLKNINHRIQEKIYPSSMRRTLHIPPAIEISFSDDAKSQLDSIKEYDAAQLSGIRYLVYRKRLVILKAYKALVSFTFATAKLTKKVLGKIKRTLGK